MTRAKKKKNQTSIPVTGIVCNTYSLMIDFISNLNNFLVQLFLSAEYIIVESS